MLPKRCLLLTRGKFEQLILRPADQRANQQIGEIEIIERLSSKPQARHQIFNRQGSAQPQPVNACNRNSARMQPRYDQACKLLAAAHQHHNIARRCMARRLALLDALLEHKGCVALSPAPDLLGDFVRHLAIMPREPILRVRAFALRLITAIGFIADRIPQGNQPGAILSAVLF